MTELFFLLVLELGLVAKRELLSLAVTSNTCMLLPSPLSSMPSFGFLCVVWDLVQLYNVVILIFIVISWEIIACP